MPRLQMALKVSVSPGVYLALTFRTLPQEFLSVSRGQVLCPPLSFMSFEDHLHGAQATNEPWWHLQNFRVGLMWSFRLTRGTVH